ncbi:MAG TPA: phosphoribosylanthranilate isomerase [Candidatus Baltobacteraceae bacterium]|nr:phosphoribosylanthranilate isomerase [Candidatus Baltobacteraceae bacterium]
MRTRIKFCGCRSVEDALLAVECGADAIGMIFAESSRRITLETAEAIGRALPAYVTPVGVFSNAEREQIEQAVRAVPGLVAQLHGDESAAFASSLTVRNMKTIHVASEDSAADLNERAAAYADCDLLLDTSAGGQRGGTGMVFPWEAAADLVRRRRVVVAGGLKPENVGECVRMLRPFGVDVCSGVETNGKKDAEKMRAFVKAVRDADAA